MERLHGGGGQAAALANTGWGLLGPKELRKPGACPTADKDSLYSAWLLCRDQVHLSPSSWLRLNSNSCRDWVGGQALPAVTRIPDATVSCDVSHMGNSSYISASAHTVQLLVDICWA